ncbi:MAG: methylmalonyl-CoA epimerase [Candidatus Zixiibacteriota bacterium]|nr:MAG: methylmalonyl-CoA epimerase [candidate division Zixibacteria bacterium]
MNNPLISHIGIAVRDIEAARKNFGLVVGDDSPEICEVADQNVRVAMFSRGGTSHGMGDRIELVAPTSADSPVARFIEKRGEGLHHICLYVDDIKKALAELKRAGVRLIDESPRVGAEGHLIAFIHPSSMNGVLIELEEKLS